MPKYTGTVNGGGVFGASGYDANVAFSGTLTVPLIITGGIVGGSYTASGSYAATSWVGLIPPDPTLPSGSWAGGGTESGPASNITVTTTSGPLAFSNATVNG